MAAPVEMAGMGAMAFWKGRMAMAVPGARVVGVALGGWVRMALSEMVSEIPFLLMSIYIIL
jgi:hypothetical protein